MRKILGISYVAVAAVLTGCIEESDDSNNQTVRTGDVPCGPEHAVSYREDTQVFDYSIATLGAVYGDGSHVDIIKDGEFRNQNLHASTQTDYTLIGNGSYYYRLGRDGIDTLQKYYLDQPLAGLYQTDNDLGFSTRSAGSEVSSNSYGLAFINESTAVMPMYALNEAWVVNTNAQTAEEFKICELDLSAYTSDNIPDAETGEITQSPPRMSMAFVNSQYAVITMQRLYDGWTPGTAYAAVFDLNDWSEVDTSPNSEGLNGIQLKLKNHQSGDLTSDGNRIYLASLLYADNSGGIEEIDLSTLTSKTVNTEFGYSAVETTANGNLYAISYSGWQNNALHELVSGNATSVSNDLSGTYLTALEAHGNDLWVGEGSNLKLLKIDATTNEQTDELTVTRPVTVVTFIED